MSGFRLSDMIKKSCVSFLFFILCVSFSFPVEHSGLISSNQTWKAIDNVHIITGNITISSGVTLTIEPGVVVKIKPKTGTSWLNLSITVNGTLSAIGTEFNPIYFTSLYDDTIGGDTNGDGNATKPSKDDWQKIFFTKDSDSADCVMQFCRFRYGSKPVPVTTGFIECQNASPRILDCEFDSGYIGVMCNVPHATSTLPTNPEIRRCQFRVLQYYGIYCAAQSQPLVEDNHFERALISVQMDLSSTPTLQGSNILGTSIWKGIGISGRATDKRLPVIDFGGYAGVPYIVMSDITVDGTLILDPGVMIKFRPLKSGDKPIGFSFNINGGLIAEGTAEKPIYFTSLLDDTVWGDTNDDGALTVPANSDWSRIYFNQSALGDRCVIKHCHFSYGGIFYDAKTSEWRVSGFINAYLSSLPITHSSFTNGWYGISLACSDSIIQNNSFKTLVYDGIFCGGRSTPDIAFNAFEECQTSIHMALTSGIDLASSESLRGNILKAKVLKGIGVSGISYDKILPQKDYAGLSNVPYIVLGNINVQGDIDFNGSLTILPGVFIKFFPFYERGFTISVGKNSRIIAEGTADLPIVFTSLRDDTEWGDTDYDNGVNLPTRSDWRRIYSGENVLPDSQSKFQYCKFKYGGKYYEPSKNLTEYYGFIDCEKSSPEICDSSFDTGWYGVRCLLTSHANIQRNSFQNLEIDAVYCGPWSNPVVSDNVFENCKRTAFHMDLSSSLDLVNPVSLANNTLLTGVLKGIGVSGTAITRNLPLREFGGIDDIPYVVLSNITVEGELSIDPGVIVKFKPNKVGNDYLGFEIMVDGFLAASGTQEQPVCFTSLHDDSLGGDANNDGNANLPAITDWKRIRFSSKCNSSLCNLSHCVFHYGGKTISKNVGYNYGFIDCDAVSPEIHDCTFENGNFGVLCSNTSAAKIYDSRFKNLVHDGLYGTVSSNPTLIGSAFENCRLSLHLDLSSSATLASDLICTGVLKGIGISNVANNTRLSKINFGGLINTPYIVMGDLRVDGIMRIDPGVIVKFKTNAQQGYSLTVNNILKALGTPEDPVYFTSLNDDLIGGDTNNDKGLIQPLKTDWQKIVFKDASNDYECVLENCRFRYGSGAVSGQTTSYWGFVECESASPHIRDSRFFSGNYGVRCLTLSHPEVSENTFYNISHDAVYANGASNPLINYCNFIPTMRTGVKNDGSPLINAEYNWWGSPDGPASVGTGSGVNVSVNVDYEPWLTEPHDLGVIQVAPPLLDFHIMNVDAGSTGPLSVQITNIGTGALHFVGKGLEITGANAADFTIFNPPAAGFIAQSHSITIDILFDPSGTGSRSAELHIITEDIYNPDAIVFLQGYGMKISIPEAIREFLLGKRIITPFERAFLDVNKDGEIDVADLIYYLLSQ
ncbi:choice-of-anchor D domain-containing protein [Candidatus Sumerlaeota bacterium]|nr:choice-of-anchor D domain-containing protein [Candidatus Sumerlaeota bacterium]